MQYVKFPMSVLRITQGYGLTVDGITPSVSGGTYSHTGSYALDLGGADTAADYLYAPCDVTVMRHYRGSGYNAVWFQTNEDVMCADGQQRQLVFMLLHANDSTITELGITAGKFFYQGEPFYKEGTGGGVATHVHLEVGLAPFTGTGWFQSNYVDDRGANVWIINNKLIPSEVFYLTGDTVVKNDMGYNWRYLNDESYIPYSSGTKVRIIPGTGKNVEYFNTASVNDVAGSGLVGGSEYEAIGYTAVADSNGFTYIKFKYSDGNEYWMAYLTDRIEVVEAEITDEPVVQEGYADYSADMILSVIGTEGKNVEYFNTPDVNDVAGILTPGTEYKALGYTTAADASGFTYIKFLFTDGNEYWVADLSDRIEIYEDIKIENYIDVPVFIRAEGSEFYLNVHGNDAISDERNVNIYIKEDVQAQRWIIKTAENGYKIHSAIDQAFALNIYTIDDNCSVYTEQGNDADSLLSLEYVDEALYRIKMASHNKYLTVDGDFASGTNVVWTDDVADATNWKFIYEDIAFPEDVPRDEFTEKGIDVSDIQGVIDWKAVAGDNIKFAILKAVGTKSSTGLYISDYWEDNYRGAKENGIKVGAYLYTYAFNESEADEELTYLFKALEGKTFEYPVFVDVEDKLLYQNCSADQITATVKHLCQKIAEKGYYPAIYTYTYFAKTYINMAELSEYDVWIADYTGSVGYTGDYTIWQYTSTGLVAGIEGNVDMNISYKDYASILNKNESESGGVVKMSELRTRIVLRNDSTTNWNANESTVLLKGEVGIEFLTDGKVKIKVGDGTKTWAQLSYFGAEYSKSEIDGLVATAKTEAVAEAVATVLGEGVDEKYDTLVEVANWILSDATSSAELIAKVGAIEADYLKGADKEELEGKITDLSGFVGTLPEGAASATVVAYIQEVVDGLKIGEYAKASDLTALGERVSGVEGRITALENSMGEIHAFMDSVEEGAQVNVIDSVDLAQFGLENKHLTLLDIAMGKVTGLTEALANKVTVQEGYRMVSEDEAGKLEKLVLGDDGSVTVSGTIAAGNVDGLTDWITARAGSLKGLSENNLSDTLLTKLNGIAEGAQVNVIEGVSVNGTLIDAVNKIADIKSTDIVKASDEITVAEDGTLGVGTVNVNKLVQTEGEVLILNGGSSII